VRDSAWHRSLQCGEAGVSMHKQVGNRLFLLLLSVVLVIILYPVLERSQAGHAFLNIFLSAIMALIVYGAARRRVERVVGLAIGIPWIVASWTGLFWRGFEASGVVDVSAVLFYSWGAVLLLRDLARARRITLGTLYAAVCGYLLIGIAWAAVYHLIETLRPDTFLISGARVGTTIAESTFIYFSFTTLTTLGYGDMTAAGGVARMLAIVEATGGVFYTAILISRLVSIYVTQNISEERK
jgi:hypothetical protein